MNAFLHPSTIRAALTSAENAGWRLMGARLIYRDARGYLYSARMASTPDDRAHYLARFWQSRRNARQTRDMALDDRRLAREMLESSIV